MFAQIEDKVIHTFLTKMEEVEAGDGEEVCHSGFQASQESLSFGYRNTWNCSTI